MIAKSEPNDCCLFSVWWKNAERMFGIVTCYIILLAFASLLAGFWSHDFFTCASALIAAAAISYQSHQISLSKKRDEPKFYLEKYMQASDMVLRRLRAGSPTKRAAWISAASIADKMNLLKAKVTEQADKEFLEIYQRDFVHLLHEFILDKSAKYFYGVSSEARDLNDAFDKSGFGKFSVSSGPMPNIPKMTWVEESSIRRVLELSKEAWREEGNYIWNGDEEFLSVIKINYPELFVYLNHLKNKKQGLHKDISITETV